MRYEHSVLAQGGGPRKTKNVFGKHGLSLIKICAKSLPFPRPSTANEKGIDSLTAVHIL